MKRSAFVAGIFVALCTFGSNSYLIEANDGISIIEIEEVGSGTVIYSEEDGTDIISNIEIETVSEETNAPETKNGTEKETEAKRKKETETETEKETEEATEPVTEVQTETEQLADADQTIYERLEDMLDQDDRIQEILDCYGSYPEDMLNLLSHNIDMLDFVLDYPEKRGQVYADTVDEAEKGEIPLLLQWDERWGYGYYGDNTVAVSGCAPTVLAMIVAGLTRDNSNTPYEIAQYAQEEGYYVPGVGTSWDLMERGCQHYGVSGKELFLSKESVFDALENGTPIACSMRPGDFTTVGHFIVLTGIEDGKIRLNDPNSITRSSRLWDYETLEGQIKNLWAFRRS